VNNRHVEPKPLTVERDGDSSMTRTFVQVMLLEAAIVVALWVFGQVFS
jgi:hypothetical protein